MSDLKPSRSPGVAIRPDGTRTFLPGHTLSVKHGIYSRFVMAEADELAATVTDASPHLADADAYAVRDWAIAQVRVWRLEAWLAEHGDLKPDGEPQPAVVELRRWMATAEKARARLGLDPTSRAALAVDETLARRQASALAREQAEEGRRLREAAEARGVIDEGDSDE